MRCRNAGAAGINHVLPAMFRPMGKEFGMKRAYAPSGLNPLVDGGGSNPLPALGALGFIPKPNAGLPNHCVPRRPRISVVRDAGLFFLVVTRYVST